MMRLLFALFFAVSYTVAAQTTPTPQVPHKMAFAGITLTIRDDARREIQKDVDALTQSPRHHNIKVERAKTYFPIIEKIFAEENVPDDFKYLALQESALIADAVSVSNAVGFWQFKDFTAMEMGLRVDKQIDERMNIASSSRAAARYFKKNNVYFNNWIYALQAYQMGAGAVMRSEKDSQPGARSMEITSKTYWYVKKYLAHKVAFEDMVKGDGQIKAMTYESQNKKSLSDFAREVSIDEEELKLYNKWTKSGDIPSDRTYVIVIPVKGNTGEIRLPNNTIASKAGETAKNSTSVSAQKESRRKVNGIPVIEARQGEGAVQLAARAGVAVGSFVKWNDLENPGALTVGQTYLLGKKRARADKAYHTVAAGDNLWSVSQQYGVQVKKLKRYNRIESDRDIKPGMTLWLSARKPKDADKTPADTRPIEIDKSQTFAWGVDPNEGKTQMPVVTTTTPVTVVTTPTPATVTTVPPADSVSETLADTVETAVEAIDSARILLPDRVEVSAPVDSTALKPVVTEPIVVITVPDTHTVQPKETLYAIARQYNLGVMDLVNLNNLNLQESIKPGMVLRLKETAPAVENTPAPATPERVETTNKPVTEVIHEVKATDTLYGIARKYGVTIKELTEWNNKKDFSLSVGEKLRIQQK
ncbi:LysM peptidoglycan-binding domain-containing protein [Fulvivirgaceae bacterium PWU5]|uniref:LysM peptidoglycan-binding domain-containing protein n=1 Tax=Dawidia cretensis TaxID=2782350 RepID=A0AAP2GUY4_9BACT|nr:LysM peptidoglycan-binding domain-containing protein [Dawidia cretensis]MBT1710158.1 LysM peptidoglycan-binding domain-containing protein [Dawidia cretensis]